MDEHIFDKVQEVDMQKTMKDYYIDYAMSVIASRALPNDSYHMETLLLENS